MDRVPQRVINRMLNKVTLLDNGCKISGYSAGGHGYAQVGWSESNKTYTVLCHRLAWYIVNGAIPEDMTIDHICKTRKCINIDHLRLLSNFENARRTSGKDWELGFCVKGHPNSELRMNSGRLRCRICANAYTKLKRGRKRIKE